MRGTVVRFSSERYMPSGCPGFGPRHARQYYSVVDYSRVFELMVEALRKGF